MIHPVGTRVLAIRDGGDGKLNDYGVGTFVGKELPPGRDSEMTDEDRAQYEAIICHHDEAAERDRTAMIAFWLERNMIAENEVEAKRSEMVAHHEAEVTKPLEQRIVEFHTSAMGNPKIVLDNGDVVWGYQCWWGPVEPTRARYRNLPENVVPIPEGNEHIDGWVPPAV